MKQNLTNQEKTFTFAAVKNNKDNNHLNELSTHSDIKEIKYNPKIFKIQKYVKSGKFDNKILSDDEFSEDEFLEKKDLGKKISPFSKVNFSKLRNKEKIQRYFMMKKLINNLNKKKKKLEKQVTRNPCRLLNKLSKIKINKMEKLSGIKNKTNSIENSNQDTKKNIPEFKFENLIKASQILYTNENFEFADEKNILNSLFRILDNEKTNLNNLQFKKISNILRSLNNENFKNKFNESNFKNLSEEKIDILQDEITQTLNLDDSLSNDNAENNKFSFKKNFVFKIIDNDDSFAEKTSDLKLSVTNKDLELIKNSSSRNEILKIISNLDDDEILNIKKNNFQKSCELKLINKLELNKIKKNSSKLKFNKRILKLAKKDYPNLEKNSKIIPEKKNFDKNSEFMEGSTHSFNCNNSFNENLPNPNISSTNLNNSNNNILTSKLNSILLDSINQHFKNTNQINTLKNANIEINNQLSKTLEFESFNHLSNQNLKPSEIIQENLLGNSNNFEKKNINENYNLESNPLIEMLLLNQKRNRDLNIKNKTAFNTENIYGALITNLIENKNLNLNNINPENLNILFYYKLLEHQKIQNQNLCNSFYNNNKNNYDNTILNLLKFQNTNEN